MACKFIKAKLPGSSLCFLFDTSLCGEFWSSASVPSSRTKKSSMSSPKMKRDMLETKYPL